MSPRLPRWQRDALLDELTKIGEEAAHQSLPDSKPPSKNWKHIAKSMAVGAGGAALGYGAAHALEHAFPALKTPTPGRVGAARIILPLLGGASLVLADRYRRLLDESYSQAPGWKKPE